MLHHHRRHARSANPRRFERLYEIALPAVGLTQVTHSRRRPTMECVMAKKPDKKEKKYPDKKKPAKKKDRKSVV